MRYRLLFVLVLPSLASTVRANLALLFPLPSVDGCWTTSVERPYPYVNGNPASACQTPCPNDPTHLCGQKSPAYRQSSYVRDVYPVEAPVPESVSSAPCVSIPHSACSSSKTDFPRFAFSVESSTASSAASTSADPTSSSVSAEPTARCVLPFLRLHLALPLRSPLVPPFLLTAISSHSSSVIVSSSTVSVDS
jgi:hypothetical protein